jgi:NEDD8-activating enzyme E1 regulatory subunit
MNENELNLNLNLKEGEESDDDLIFYLLIRAVESFYSEYNRYPGTNNDSFDLDVTMLKKFLNKLLNEHRINITIKEEYVYEM